MKMKSYMAMLMAAAAMVCTTSCDDDDDEPSLAEQVANTYTGWSVASCTYFSNYGATEGQVVSVSKVTDTTVEVSFESNFGTFVSSTATVSKRDGVKTITGSGKVSMAGMSGAAKEYDFTLDGKVGDNASFVFSTPAVMGGLDVVFTEGEMPAELKAE